MKLRRFRAVHPTLDTRVMFVDFETTISFGSIVDAPSSAGLRELGSPSNQHTTFTAVEHGLPCAHRMFFLLPNSIYLYKSNPEPSAPEGGATPPSCLPTTYYLPQYIYMFRCATYSRHENKKTQKKTVQWQLSPT